MKAHLAKVSLALLSVAFLLGCQEQGSDPVGPEGLGPEFHHGKGSHADGGGGASSGDNPGSSIYKYTFTGSITTFPLTADARSTVGNDDGGEIRLHGCCERDPALGIDDEELILSAFLGELVGTDADACFSEIIPLVEFIGTLRPDKKDMNKVEAVFNFKAMDKNGTPDVDYVLKLDGGVTTTTDDAGDGIFPPEPGETTTVTFTDASIGAQRKKEKNACSGVTTDVDISVLVEGIS